MLNFRVSFQYIPVVLDRSIAVGARLGIFLEYLSSTVTWYPKSNFWGIITFRRFENGNSLGTFHFTVCEVLIFCRVRKTRMPCGCKKGSGMTLVGAGVRRRRKRGGMAISGAGMRLSGAGYKKRRKGRRKKRKGGGGAVSYTHLTLPTKA